MRDWLASRRLTPVQFEDMLTATLLVRRLRHSIATERMQTYFDAHRSEFDQVHVVEVRAATQADAERVLSAAHSGGSLLATAERLLDEPEPPSITLSLRACFAADVPAAVRASVGLGGAIIAEPQVAGQRAEEPIVLMQVRRSMPATLDDRTRQAVEEAVYQEWVAERRAAADVQWHWS
jgi:hypothetical protein